MLKVPKPTRVILSPVARASETAETNPSTPFSACDLVIPPSFAIFAINSAFVIFFHRVAGGCRQPQAPLEPCMRLSPHTARASLKAAPVGLPGCVTSRLHRPLSGDLELVYLRSFCFPYGVCVVQSKRRLQAYKG